MADFIWGQGGERLSPQEAARQREMAQALLGQNNAVATNPWEGIAQIARAYTGNTLEGRASEAEEAGRAELAQLLAGVGPDTDMSTLMSIYSNGWANPQEQGIAELLINQDMQQQAQAAAWAREDARSAAEWERGAPMRDAQLEALLMGNQMTQLELDQARNPTPAPLPYEVIDGQVVQIDPLAGTTRSIGNYAAPEPVFTTLTAEDAAARGLDPSKSWQVGPDQRLYEVGGGGVNVSVNGGGKFDEVFAGEDAKALTEVSAAGNAAIRNIGRIDQLETLLNTAPTGMGARLTQIAGEFGISTEGLDEVQAAQALINSLVPEQRQPGSGPMSDADLELFKQSLPRIINQPGGNQRIIDTMRAIAEYDAEGARIVQQLRGEEITRSEAFAMLQNRPNPLAGITAAPPAPPVQNAVTTAPPAFASQADYDAAPSGTIFTAPDGSIRRKP